MEDDELKAIRARRLAELQGQDGGSAPQVIVFIRVLNLDFDNENTRVPDLVLVWALLLELPRKMLKRKGKDLHI
jgi:hypothetical protein